MALVVDIELLTGRYDAADRGQESGEWPPHPARVFCAFVASAQSDADRAALRWWEQQGPPLIDAAPEAATVTRSAYVVTNVRTKGGSQNHIARTNALKTRASTLPGSTQVRLMWPDAVPSDDIVTTLDHIARRIPYLGRATGVAALRVAGSVVSHDRSSEPLRSLVPDASGTLRLRVPYPGYLDDLTAQFEAGRSAWEIRHDIRYRASIPGAEVEEPRPMQPSVYRDVIVLRFAGLKPEGRLLARFTEALRKAVMAATQDPLPPQLHGHGADGRPHVAFLALPDVGHEHAQGRLLGLAVAIPALGQEERKSVVRGVLHGMRTQDPQWEDERELDLSVPTIGNVSLLYKPGLVRPWAVNPERWRRGSDTWVSATPVVLDRFPKRGEAAAEIRRSCEQLGLPPLLEVETSPEALVPGAIRLRPRDLPERARGKLYCHVRLRFDRPVAGPLLIGAGRYLGLGLLSPETVVPPENSAASANDSAVVGDTP